jgi:hypothetical protein
MEDKLIARINKSDIVDIIINQLKKRDKLISIGELKALINLEITKNNKNLYNNLNKLRKDILKLKQLKGGEGK